MLCKTCAFAALECTSQTLWRRWYSLALLRSAVHSSTWHVGNWECCGEEERQRFPFRDTMLSSVWEYRLPPSFKLSCPSSSSGESLALLTEDILTPFRGWCDGISLPKKVWLRSSDSSSSSSSQVVAKLPAACSEVTDSLLSNLKPIPAEFFDPQCPFSLGTCLIGCCSIAEPPCSKPLEGEAAAGCARNRTESQLQELESQPTLWGTHSAACSRLFCLPLAEAEGSTSGCWSPDKLRQFECIICIPPAPPPAAATTHLHHSTLDHPGIKFQAPPPVRLHIQASILAQFVWMGGVGIAHSSLSASHSSSSVCFGF